MSDRVYSGCALPRITARACETGLSSLSVVLIQCMPFSLKYNLVATGLGATELWTKPDNAMPVCRAP